MCSPPPLCVADTHHCVPHSLTRTQYTCESSQHLYTTNPLSVQSWIRMRQHLLASILHQKMGLNHHLLPLEQPTGKSNEQLNIKFTMGNIDLLISNPLPRRDKAPQPTPQQQEEDNSIDFSTVLKNWSPQHHTWKAVQTRCFYFAPSFLGNIILLRFVVVFIRPSTFSL